MSYMFQPLSVVIIRHEYYTENMGMYATMQNIVAYIPMLYL